MAHIHGKPGLFAEETGTRKRCRLILLLCVCPLMSGIIIGWMIACSHALWPALIGTPILMIFIRYIDKESTSVLKESRNWYRGATGEQIVGAELELLPDSYHVFHDLKMSVNTPENLDHTVIGPTGIFVVETKNWKGAVTARNSGLMRNGEPDNTVNILLSRIMTLREKLTALTEIDNLFIRGLIVFPNAWVMADWGTTKNTICLSMEQLNDFIEKKDQYKHPLPPKHQKALVRAMTMLAETNAEFEKAVLKDEA